MTSTLQHRLQEVRSHYQSGDYNLGLRRLLDAALDTRQPAIFEQVLAFCDKSEAPGTTPSLTEVDALLDKIGNAGMAEGANKEISLLKAEGVAKQYSGGRFKLSPVNLDLKRGEIAGLVGENGNGKTTLLRILVGELFYDEGSITYNLHHRLHDKYEKRTFLAFIPQRIPKWWGTLTDNLHFTARHYGLIGRENELWVEMIIARLGLRPYKNLSWNSISSGYRTRFEIARTLLRKPEVLLLDEPLANLDIISQQTILQDLRYLAQSPVHPMAVVLSSQQIYEVEKVSDKIVFLKQGTPIYQDLKQAPEEKPSEELKALFEIETAAPREELTKLLQGLPLEQIQFNGGIYIATFKGAVTTAQVMEALSRATFDINYLRNISLSSRRFFANQ